MYEADASRMQSFSMDGFLGIGSTLHSRGAFTLDAIDRCFVVDIPARRLKDEPGFEKDHLARHHRYRLARLETLSHHCQLFFR
jgi:hypothetical protein